LTALLGSAAPAAARQAEPAGQETDAGGLVALELRVISSGPGSTVTIDRGSSDALAEDDVVLFHPRSGGVLSGTVSAVNRRSARVDLHDPSAIPEVGTRGEVRIPRERQAALAEERRAAREQRDAERQPEATAPAPEQAQQGVEPQQADPWSNDDQDWSEGMPLLAEVGQVRPEQRAPRIGGRYYLIADQILTSEDDRHSGFYRAGTSITYENPFGYGDELHFDGEVNYRYVEVPDDEDQDGGELRLDRLSYLLGGTRFAPTRQEFGRFLQHGMPEFGVLDGYEWGRRTDGGQRYGVSLGLMPEPDEDMHTGQDFQVAGWYQWVSDLSERVSATAGFQKSWHDGDVDRDLLVTKFHYLPPHSTGGWDLQGTAWIDLYTSGDTKSGLGLTQAYLTAHRTFASKNSLSFTYSHLEFPDIERTEFAPPNQNELEDERRDRVEVAGRCWVAGDQRLLGSLGLWIDDEEEGGDAELGYEVVQARAHTGVSAFTTLGEYTTSIGLRAFYSHFVDNGRWEISTEIANQDILGFDDDNDDLFQQRVRGLREFTSLWGWSFSGYFEIDYWEEEEGLTLGFYAQRSF
jgi:hypothetical protein